MPTFKESGVKGLENFTFSTYTGLFGPAKMPPEVLAKLNDAMVKVLTDPAVIKRFADLTAEARASRRRSWRRCSTPRRSGSFR